MVLLPLMLTMAETTNTSGFLGVFFRQYQYTHIVHKALQKLFYVSTLPTVKDK